jgi:hypothetical protein
VVQGGGDGRFACIFVADYRVLLADYVVEVAADGAVSALDNVIIPEYGISHSDDFIVMPDNDVPVADDRAVVAHDALAVHCDKGVVCMCPRFHFVIGRIRRSMRYLCCVCLMSYVPITHTSAVYALITATIDENTPAARNTVPIRVWACRRENRPG